MWTRWHSPGSTEVGRLILQAITALPDDLHVGPEYGVALIKGARPEAAALMLHILSPAGQATLVRHGFTAVALPSP